MDDLAAFLFVAALFSGVLVVGLSVPVRVLDWIDRHVLAPSYVDVDEIVR